jgi:2-C-methyl-D-erythritol 4-phosphate cytidylyltransferase
MKAAAIIVAGGCGKRFGAKTPKQFLPLFGKPVFLWSSEAFASIKAFRQIIIVVPKQFIKFTENALGSSLRFAVTEGGKERFDSVKNGLALVNEDADYIAVHDAARPLTTRRDILAVLKKAAEEGRGALAVEKTKDTVKTVKNGYVVKTLDRNVLYNAQTPQIFKAGLLRKAYSKKISPAVTDDSMLAEILGEKISAVETKSPNFKITTKNDFEFAKEILKRR